MEGSNKNNSKLPCTGTCVCVCVYVRETSKMVMFSVYVGGSVGQLYSNIFCYMKL